jgi:drug/metabolite transporter (DMT)-like permease
MSLATLITAAFIRSVHIREIKRLTTRECLLLFLAGMFLALHFAFWIKSLEITSVASSVVLVTTTPIWVAILSPFLLAEKLNIRAAFFLAIAFLGSLLVTLGGSCSFLNGSFTCIPGVNPSHGIQGNLLALFGAFMAAGYVLAGRKLRKSVSLISYTTLVNSVASCILLLLCLYFKQPLLGFTPNAFLWLACLAFIPQLFGHTAINWVLGLLPAALVSIALLGEPIGSSFLAWLFLREIPTWAEWVGGGLILFGIINSTRAIHTKA